jgi:ribonuclease T2
MLDIMPDPALIQHEWLTHGTCSGLSADDYFALIRKAYNSIHIPSKFQASGQTFTTTPAQITNEFAQANLKLPPQAVEVACRGYYLSAVEICLDKNLVAMTCPTPPPCHAQTIRVPAAK